jgi:hypothetical protein
MCFLLTSTAADTILFVVKTAAAVAPLGQTISPKSGLPDSFIPQLTPPAKNPFATVIVLFVMCALHYVIPAQLLNGFQQTIEPIHYPFIPKTLAKL